MIVQGDAEAKNAEQQKVKLRIKVPSVATQTVARCPAATSRRSCSASG